LLSAIVTQDPVAFQNFWNSMVAVIAVVCTVGSFVIMLMNRRSTQKREVSFSEEYALKSDLLQFRRDHEREIAVLLTGLAEIRREMKADREALAVAGEARAEKIHNRINTVLEAVSELRGHVNAAK